jgi:hypothetical protein
MNVSKKVQEISRKFSSAPPLQLPPALVPSSFDASASNHSALFLLNCNDLPQDAQMLRYDSDKEMQQFIGIKVYLVEPNIVSNGKARPPLVDPCYCMSSIDTTSARCTVG